MVETDDQDSMQCKHTTLDLQECAREKGKGADALSVILCMCSFSHTAFSKIHAGFPAKPLKPGMQELQPDTSGQGTLVVTMVLYFCMSFGDYIIFKNQSVTQLCHSF